MSKKESKHKKAVKINENYEKELKDSFDRWDYIYKFGGSDPFWADGASLNLVRNHIDCYKHKLEESEYYPKIYYRQTPPKVEESYMARAEEIRKNANKALSIYILDDNYKFLTSDVCRLSDTEKKEIYLETVLGYAKGLSEAIRNDDLVTMRRHEHYDSYLSSFKECREKAERILSMSKHLKEGQLSIFDLRNVR